ncbi:hypothetical protein M0R19_08865 [Candidatus Pacearchaeota archaeon]|nr:hypothetical protein [Candidatus Pacearchaeota archaeon]
MNSDFNSYLFSNTLLDSAMKWIKENVSPQDIYDEKQLLDWMNSWLEDNDMKIVQIENIIEKEEIK